MRLHWQQSGTLWVHVRLDGGSQTIVHTVAWTLSCCSCTAQQGPAVHLGASLSSPSLPLRIPLPRLLAACCCRCCLQFCVETMMHLTCTNMPVEKLDHALAEVCCCKVAASTSAGAAQPAGCCSTGAVAA